MSLSLPLKVQGHDHRGVPWEEMSTVDDVSARGAGFSLRHSPYKGQILHLTLPLPKRFRQHDISDPSYRIYSVVRWTLTIDTGWRVGVLFLGKFAPRDFDKDPGGIYLLPSDPAPTFARRAERRRYDRLDIIVNLRLRRLPGRPGPMEELTIAENIGRGGVRVLSTLPVERDEVLLLEEVGGSFQTRVAVRNVWTGPDNVPRLNLEFLDELAPDRLVATS